MKKVMDPDPAGQKSTDLTGSGSSSLYYPLNFRLLPDIEVDPRLLGLTCFQSEQSTAEQNQEQTNTVARKRR